MSENIEKPKPAGIALDEIFNEMALDKIKHPTTGQPLTLKQKKAAVYKLRQNYHKRTGSEMRWIRRGILPRNLVMKELGVGI